MKAFSIVLGSLTSLILLSTLICGMWIKSKGITEPSSLNFHAMIGIASVVSGLLSSVTLIILAFKR